MAYRIDLDDSVIADVSGLNPAARHYWRTCLRVIAQNPDEHKGTLTDAAFPLPGSPTMDFAYEITRHEVLSGEVIYVFTADCFPNRAIVYVLAEPSFVVGFEGDVRVIFLRPYDQRQH